MTKPAIYVLGVSRDSCQFWVEGVSRLGLSDDLAVVAIDHPAYLDGLSGYLDHYDSRLSVSSPLDSNAVSSVIAQAVEECGEPILIVSNFDTCIATAGQAAELLREKFPTVNKLIPTPQATDKATFRMRMDQLGHSEFSPRHISVSGPEEVSGSNLPAHSVVVKADLSAGSLGTYLAEGVEETRAAVTAALSGYLHIAARAGRAVIEEFIPGDEYSIQAFVREGEVTIATVAKKITRRAPAEDDAEKESIIEFAHVLQPGPVATPAKPRLRALTDAVAETLNCVNGVLQIDVIEGRDGRLIAIDAGARPSGGNLPRAQWKMGMDMTAPVVAAQLGLPPRPLGDAVQIGGRASLATADQFNLAKALEDRSKGQIDVVPNLLRKPGGPIVLEAKSLHSHWAARGTMIAGGTEPYVNEALKAISDVDPQPDRPAASNQHC